MSSAFWFTKSKLSARIQFLLSKELSQLLQPSNCYYFNCV